MKRLILLSLLALCQAGAFAQFAPAYVIRENFDTYNGTTGSIPTNWFISYNNSAAGSNASFYTTTQSSGVAPNSYKFRTDSSYIITPDFTTDADSLIFWLKGNSVDTISAFNIFEGADTLSWTLIDRFDHISLSGTTYRYGLSAGTRFVKFLYEKSVGNVAFDDVDIFANSTVGISKSKITEVKITPTVSTSGEFKVNGLEEKSLASVSVYDLLGNKVGTTKQIKNNALNISGGPGCYIVKIEQNNRVYVQRLIIQ